MYWRSVSPVQAGFGRCWRAKIFGMVECVMLMKREKLKFERPVVVEDLATRKKRQAVEGSLAMKEYRLAQQAATERMLALRRERLAQLSNETG
jgi:hypothetical protein